MRQVLLLIFVFVVASCSAGTSQPAGETGSDSLGAAVPAIADLPEKGVSAFSRYSYGSEFLAAKNVSAEGMHGIFEPTWSDGSGEYAYGLYGYNLVDIEGACYLLTSWETPPDSDDLWLGLPNRVESRWEWHQPVPGVGLFIETPETYLNTEQELYAVILVAADGEFALRSSNVNDTTPYSYTITPTLVEPGESVKFSSNYYGCEPLDFTWDFGGMATPSISTENQPTVVITDTPGTYTVSLMIGNQLGGEAVEYDVTVQDWKIDLPEGHLAALPLKSNAVVGESVPVIVYCGDFPANAPLAYMTGVAISCEPGGDYVDGTYNTGHPGGIRTDWDGIWAQMQPVPPVAALPTDGILHDQPVYGEDKVYMGFCIPPVHATNMAGGGVLFNISMEFSEPGTYHIGFLEMTDIKRTYYSDETGAEHFWLDVTNSGVPNTIVVTAE